MTNSGPTRPDVAIVGGGVVGATAAIFLAKAGFRVTVAERTRVFRDRVRGEGIHPWGMNEAADLGIAPVIDRSGGNPLPDWQSYQDRLLVNTTHWTDISRDGAVETSVFHPVLQQQLIEAAGDTGASIRRGTELTAIERTGAAFSLAVRGPDGVHQIHAPVVIAADGSGSRTARLLGIRRHRDPDHHWLAGLRVADHGLDPTATHGVDLEGGHCFIFPQSEQHARLYAVLRTAQMAPIRRDQSGARLLATVAPAFPGGNLDRAVTAGPQGVFGNADSWAGEHGVPGLLLIGDAANANDPTQGHGLSLAFRDVNELRKALEEGEMSVAALRAVQKRIVQYRQTMRTTARWMAMLWMAVCEEADARRERYHLARENDPEAGGYARLLIDGPAELIPDAAAERRFFEGPDAS